MIYGLTNGIKESFLSRFKNTSFILSELPLLKRGLTNQSVIKFEKVTEKKTSDLIRYQNRSRFLRLSVIEELNFILTEDWKVTVPNRRAHLRKTCLKTVLEQSHYFEVGPRSFVRS